MICHGCNIALFTLAPVAEMGLVSASHLNEILIFDFFEMTFSFSRGKIYSANTQQFWFEHYPAEHKLRSVVPLVFFKRKTLRSAVELSGLKNRF